MKENKKRTTKRQNTARQNKAEWALKDDKEICRIIFNSISDGIGVIDLSNGKIIDVNEGILNMFEYRREDIIGMTVEIFLAENDRQRAVEAFSRTLETGDSGLEEWRLLGKGGSTHECEMRASIVYDNDNKPEYMVNVIRDIGKRKRIDKELKDTGENLETMVEERTSALVKANEALRESEEWHRALIETAGRADLGIGVIQNIEEREAALIYVNDKSCEIAGYTRDELLNMTLWDLMPPDEIENIMLKYKERQKGAPVLHTYETVFVRKDKVRISIIVSVDFMQLGGKPATAIFFRDITTQKQAEEALRASEEKFRVLAEYSNDTIMRFDRNHRHLYVNPIVAIQTGLKPGDFLGRTHRELGFPEHLVKIWEEAIDRVFTTAKPHNIEFQLPSGIWIDWLLMPELSADWRVTAVITAGRDISERKKAEEELRQSEEKLRILFQTIGVGITSTDMTGKITDVNEAVIKLYDLGSKEEIVGKSGFDFVSNKDKVLQGFANYLATGTTVPMEIVFLHRDGSEYICETETTVMHDSTGNPSGMIIVQRDVTRRKQAEEAIAQAKRDLENVLTAATQVAVIATDTTGLITTWNSGAERMLGYTAVEIVGRQTPAVIHLEAEVAAHGRVLSEELGERIEGFEVFVARAKRGGYEEREWTYVRKDGTHLTVNLSVTAVRDESGQFTGFLGTALDITERRKAEESLKRMNEMLEEQTILANDLAAQAEYANAAKSEFLANMSHEIRTPLNGVIGMTELLLDTDLTEEQRRYTEIVRSSGESLLGLINDILDFSKIESGKFILETLDFDLIPMLDDFAITMVQHAQDKGLELICSADPDVPSLLRGDPGRLRQILTNLVGNAIKFTSKGEVSIRTSVESQGDEEVVLRFTARDTGIGIPADKIGLLFDKFTQADSSTTRRYGGTGLGLAISKQLAEMMGGRIGVSSKEGEGSEFWFTARFTKQSKAGKAVVSMRAHLQYVRVLIVDDNATSRKNMTILLNSWDMRPEEAEDGPAALKSLYRALQEKDPFCAAIIDGQMPGMDGEALGRAIHSDPRLAQMRMVILTSLGIRGDAKRFTDIGFSGYLTKPVQQQELMDVLSMVLAEQPGETPGSKAIANRHTARETKPRLQELKARILLVEDNITNQQLALSILKKIGLSADAVANGQEALRALETIPYDLILMDCQMPVMDGYEATQEIRNPRSKVRNHTIPIIAMTAHSLQGDREKCLEAGMNDYLPKPISPKTLAWMLEKWLTKDKGSGLNGKMESSRKEDKEASPAEPPVWDRKGMLERLMCDEDLAGTIMEGFLTDIPDQIRNLEKFIESGDLSAAARQAHSIKGAAANVGGERLRAVAFDMEKAAKEGKTATVRSRMGDLNREFETLKQSVREAR